MKKWKEDLDHLVSLEYIHFINVPMKESKHGPVIDLPVDALDKMAATAVIKNRIPLRGKEVKFLRKVIGLSLEKFAGKMGLSSGTIFHWEKAETDQLAPVNEAAVRTLIAEEMGIEIPAKFSLLIGDKIYDVDIKAS